MLVMAAASSRRVARAIAALALLLQPAGCVRQRVDPAPIMSQWYGEEPVDHRMGGGQGYAAPRDPRLGGRQFGARDLLPDVGLVRDGVSGLYADWRNQAYGYSSDAGAGASARARRSPAAPEPYPGYDGRVSASPGVASGIVRGVPVHHQRQQAAEMAAQKARGRRDGGLFMNFDSFFAPESSDERYGASPLHRAYLAANSADDNGDGNRRMQQHLSGDRPWDTAGAASSDRRRPGDVAAEGRRALYADGGAVMFTETARSADEWSAQTRHEYRYSPQPPFPSFPETEAKGQEAGFSNSDRLAGVGAIGDGRAGVGGAMSPLRTLATSDPVYPASGRSRGYSGTSFDRLGGGSDTQSSYDIFGGDSPSMRDGLSMHDMPSTRGAGSGGRPPPAMEFKPLEAFQGREQLYSEAERMGDIDALDDIFKAVSPLPFGRGPSASTDGGRLHRHSPVSRSQAAVEPTGRGNWREGAETWGGGHDMGDVLRGRFATEPPSGRAVGSAQSPVSAYTASNKASPFGGSGGEGDMFNNIVGFGGSPYQGSRGQLGGGQGSAPGAPDSGSGQHRSFRHGGQLGRVVEKPSPQLKEPPPGSVSRLRQAPDFDAVEAAMAGLHESRRLRPEAEGGFDDGEIQGNENAQFSSQEHTETSALPSASSTVVLPGGAARDMDAFAYGHVDSSAWQRNPLRVMHEAHVPSPAATSATPRKKVAELPFIRALYEADVTIGPLVFWAPATQVALLIGDKIDANKKQWHFVEYHTHIDPPKTPKDLLRWTLVISDSLLGAATFAACGSAEQGEKFVCSSGIKGRPAMSVLMSAREVWGTPNLEITTNASSQEVVRIGLPGAKMPSSCNDVRLAVTDAWSKLQEGLLRLPQEAKRLLPRGMEAHLRSVQSPIEWYKALTHIKAATAGKKSTVKTLLSKVARAVLKGV